MVNIISYTAKDPNGQSVVIDINQKHSALKSATDNPDTIELRVDMQGNPFAAKKVAMGRDETRTEVQVAVNG